MGQELRVVVWMKWKEGVGELAQVFLWRIGQANAETKDKKVRLDGIGCRFIFVPVFS